MSRTDRFENNRTYFYSPLVEKEEEEQTLKRGHTVVVIGTYDYISNIPFGNYSNIFLQVGYGLRFSTSIGRSSKTGRSSKAVK